MASLALGLIGGYFFGPIGFMIGSMIGNLLTPSKQEGPRLSNLHLQGSEYGKMIAIPYGTVRVSGNVIWQTDLKEHKHTSGGKGGPQGTTYTYTVSFATKVCKGPLAGFLRIWAQGTLVYDTTGQSGVDNSRIPVTFYLGVESADPDPTMQADLGVGNVPAFRDDAAAVFADWDVGIYGNMIPNLSFEVFTTGGPIPWRVASFAPFNTTILGPHSAAVVDGELQISRWTGGSACLFELNHYTLAGVLKSSDPPVIGPVLPTDDGGSLVVFYCQNNPHIAFANMNGASGINNGGFYYDGAITCALLFNQLAVGAGGGSIVYGEAADAVYGVGNNADATVRKFASSGGAVTSGATVASYALPSGAGSEWQVTVDENGDVWAGRVRHNDEPGSTVQCVKLDADLNFLDSWTRAETPPFIGNGPGFLSGATNFVVWGGHVLFNNANPDEAYTPGHPWTLAGSCAGHTGGGNILSLGNGLGLDAEGIVSLSPQPGGKTLDAIVGDLSSRAGLQSSEYDVTGLALTTVPGFLVTSRTDVRSDIAPLQNAYFFDAVESSGVMRFVMRGGAIAATIPDDDLAAQTPGAQPPPLIEVKRVEDLALPAEVDVTYFNTGASYQPGTQRATRQTTNSQAVSDLQLPIAMADQDAARIAQIQIIEAWYARSSFIVRLPRKYLYLEPTDVITVRSKTLRIARKQDKTDGTIEFEGVRTLASMYVSGVPGSATSGGPPPVAGAGQATALLLLDIPLIVDTDDQNGFYAGMAGAVDATWRGANLNKSSDGGSSYASVGSSAVGDVMGVTSDALGPWAGGFEFDESNRVTVVVGPGGGELTSATGDAVLNGANHAIVGDEVVQFKVADLVSAGTYQLSGLLRGCRGTEWATVSHIAGERFCLMPVTDVSALPSELGQSRLYKPVTFGDTLAGTTAYPFTNNGAALRPYSVVGLGGAPVSPFDGAVGINWTRRTRIGGTWVDFVDVPLSEPVEKYIVEIWDSTFTNVARIIETATPTLIYTAAQQVADFGATQAHIYVSVGQVGAYRLGTQTSAVIPGSGSTDDAVLAPIPPYNSPPPPPAGGCTLPTVIDDFVWSAPVSQFNPGAGPTGTWVLRFTTGAIVAGAGHIDAAEFSGPPTQRDAVLALSPCGAPLTPASHQVGNTVSVIFYMQDNPHPTIYPTLLPLTTYYFSINSLAASGMICNLSTPH